MCRKLQILGINMAVGINGLIGKPMIREGRDIHVYVRRSLRDVFRKVPTFALEVKVGPFIQNFPLSIILTFSKHVIMFLTFYLFLNVSCYLVFIISIACLCINGCCSTVKLCHMIQLYLEGFGLLSC